MMRFLLAAAVTLTAVLGMTPVSAQYYVSPEDMLYQTGYAYPEEVLGQESAFLVPSGKRGAQWTADLQAQQSAERHPTIYRDPWEPEPNAGIPPPPPPPYSYTQQPHQQTPQQGFTGLDPITARLLERLSRDNIVQTQVPGGILPSTAWNVGAPLAHTGPEAVLVVIAMLAATAWTLRRARVLERFVR